MRKRNKDRMRKKDKERQIERESVWFRGSGQVDYQTGLYQLFKFAPRGYTQRVGKEEEGKEENQTVKDKEERKSKKEKN